MTLSSPAAASATVRAGNVIGGGDWAADRLVPDAVRAGLTGTPLAVRAPEAVRPWHHVLYPLGGYLVLVQHFAGRSGLEFADAWNFGTVDVDRRSVRWVVESLSERWPGGLEIRFGTGEVNEASITPARFVTSPQPAALVPSLGPGREP